MVFIISSTVDESAELVDVGLELDQHRVLARYLPLQVGVLPLEGLTGSDLILQLLLNCIHDELLALALSDRHGGVVIHLLLQLIQLLYLVVDAGMQLTEWALLLEGVRQHVIGQVTRLLCAAVSRLERVL